MPELVESALNRHVIRAEERGSCEVPLALMSGESLGQLSLGQLSGLVDFKYAGNNVKLVIGGIVGHVPLSNRITLVVSPKFSISNMSRMVWRSRKSISRSTSVDRFYELARSQTYSLEVMLRLFARHLGQLLVQGIHRAYKPHQHTSIPRPHIEFGRTNQRYWSRGLLSAAVVTEFNLSGENVSNSLLKSAVAVALRHTKQLPDFSDEKEIFRMTQDALQGVSSIKRFPTSREVSRALEEVPTFRPAYLHAVPLALELIKGTSIWLDRDRSGLFGPSFLVNLEDVFEGYVRNVLHEGFQRRDIQVSVLDGNKKKWKGKLFNDTDRYDVKPDLIFRSSDRIEMIGDAKYKTKSKEEDRYQVLTHALSMKCKRAILIYPASEKVASGLRRIGEIGPVEFAVTLYEYGISLSDDLEVAEETMADALSGIIKSTS